MNMLLILMLTTAFALSFYAGINGGQDWTWKSLDEFLNDMLEQ